MGVCGCFDDIEGKEKAKNNNTSNSIKIIPNKNDKNKEPQKSNIKSEDNTIYFNKTTNIYVSKNVKEDIIKYKKEEINNNEEEKIELNNNNNNEEEENNIFFKNYKLKMKEFEEMNEQFDNVYNDFNFDLKEHNVMISYYNESLNRYYTDMNSIQNDLYSCNIALDDKDFLKNIEERKINEEFKEYEKKYEELDKMINDRKKNIHQLEVIYNNIKNKIKDKNELIEIIQNKFNEINNYDNSDSIIFTISLSASIDGIKENVNKFQNMIKDLKNEINSYKNERSKIEDNENKNEEDLILLREKIKKLSETISTKYKEYKKQLGNENEVIKNSMLMVSNQDPNKIFKSNILFNNDNNEDNNIKRPSLIYQNWNEKCYIYNEYDLHEITFELKAVGLFGNIRLKNCLIGLNLDTEIEILELKIDDEDKKSEVVNYSIKFGINLGNGESNRIYLKYKESPKLDSLTEGEIKERNYFRINFYGIKNYIKNKVAKYTLYNKSDFEIISFEDEFLVKSNDNEYTWGGTVPDKGKRTMIIMSKKEGKYNFEIIESIENIDKKPIEKEKLFVPFYFEGGNNKITLCEYSSKEADDIIKNEENKQYEIIFNNIKGNKAKFTMNYELLNRCKGEWICDLTDDEIDDIIPKDFKEDFETNKELSTKIIQMYDEEHKEEYNKVNDIVKIGKWIKKYIKFDINYRNKYDISARETLNKRVGSSYHIAQVFNALMYSLNYKCICIYGYYATKTTMYNQNDLHFWSLIHVDDKWLPFDATYGYFSGKLPISYVFCSYYNKRTSKEGSDNVIIKDRFVNGNILINLLYK